MRKTKKPPRGVCSANKIEEEGHKHRCYFVTDFVCELEFWKTFTENELLTYIIIGQETCPDTKRLHWHVFLKFKNTIYWDPLRKKLTPRNVKPMISNEWSLYKYTTKDNNIIMEIGKRPKQGKRTDMDSLKEMIKNNSSDQEIFLSQPNNFIRYFKGINIARNLFAPHRDWKMDVRIHWGSSGTGKTKSVWTEFGLANVYPKMVGKWWDGYKGQECVLIDDFDPSNCFDIQFDFYLKLLDRYPLIIETKGGTLNFCSKIIIITSNHDPNDWFLLKPNREAFFRRITSIKFFGAEV